MASSKHVLRIRRIYEKKKGDDDEDREHDDFVFLYISCTTPHPINLRLLATEGENAYVATINSTRIQEARDTKSPLTPPQWSDTLLSLLLQRPSTPANATTSLSANDEKIELVGSIASSSPPSELNLLIRKNISGITQRLGTLTLPHDDNEVVDTLHWTSVAIDRATALDQEVASLTSNHKAAEKAVASLNSQLEELVAAKQAHESSLMRKCQELLNQKKLKIREQLRLLACTSSERRRGERILGGDSEKVIGARTRVTAAAESTGKRKRKAEDAALRQDGGYDEGDKEEVIEGLSSARIKEEEKKRDGDENMDHRVETPEAEEEDEDDMTEDEEVDLHNNDKERQDDGAHGERMRLDDASPSAAKDLPPDRDLPFGKAASKPAMVTPQEAGNEDQETDDDDDDDDEL